MQTPYTLPNTDTERHELFIKPLTQSRVETHHFAVKNGQYFDEGKRTITRPFKHRHNADGWMTNLVEAAKLAGFATIKILS